MSYLNDSKNMSWDDQLDEILYEWDIARAKRREKALQEWKNAKDRVEQQKDLFEQNKFNNTVSQVEEDFAVVVDRKMQCSPRNKKRKNWVATRKSERNPTQKKIQKVARSRRRLPYNRKKGRQDKLSAYEECEQRSEQYSERVMWTLEDEWKLRDLREKVIDEQRQSMIDFWNWGESESDGGMEEFWRYA